MIRLRVAVLMGGVSSERTISISTGKQIVAALDPDKYTVQALDPAALTQPRLLDAGAGSESSDRSDESGSCSLALAPLTMSQLASAEPSVRPDVVFIALHGKGGEDGTIQGMLECLGIPYTGSGVLASALAIDKSLTKRVLESHGIAVPREIAVRRTEMDMPRLGDRVASELGYPVVVKPNSGGSTIGCAIVRTPEELLPAVTEAFRHDATVLIEQLVAGVEITAGVLGNAEPEVLPLVEIVAQGGFYDYEAKYAPGGSTHIVPARIGDAAAALARDYAAKAHCALGCRGMSRVDMIVVGDQPWVLEVNTIPGMTPTSLLPDAARAAGISFAALLDRIIVGALVPR